MALNPFPSDRGIYPDFPYSVEVDSYIFEAQSRFDWVKDNIGIKNFRTTTSWRPGRMLYIFAVESDASFFALRWVK